MEGENQGHDDEKSITGDDEFVDDDISLFSTQTVASNKVTDIYGQNRCRPSNKECVDASNEGGKIGVENCAELACSSLHTELR